MSENLHYESVHFKELHNEQEYYRPTIYRAGASVVSTNSSLSYKGESIRQFVSIKYIMIAPAVMSFGFSIVLRRPRWAHKNCFSSSYPGDLPQQNLKPQRLKVAELYRLRYFFQEESESVSRVKCRCIWGIWPPPYRFGDFLNRSLRGQFVCGKRKKGTKGWTIWFLMGGLQDF